MSTCIPAYYMHTLYTLLYTTYTNPRYFLDQTKLLPAKKLTQRDMVSCAFPLLTKLPTAC